MITKTKKKGTTGKTDFSFNKPVQKEVHEVDSHKAAMKLKIITIIILVLTAGLTTYLYWESLEKFETLGKVFIYTIIILSILLHVVLGFLIMGKINAKHGTNSKQSIVSSMMSNWKEKKAHKNMITSDSKVDEELEDSDGTH